MESDIGAMLQTAIDDGYITAAEEAAVWDELKGGDEDVLRWWWNCLRQFSRTQVWNGFSQCLA